MDCKKQIAYEAVFRYIHENLIPLNCQHFMTDFEKAIRNALLAVVPNAKLASCRFHYAQACKRRAATKNGQMVQLCRADEKAARLYYKLLALPLLPAINIQPAFNIIKQQVQSLGENESGKFKKYLDYMENQWISGKKV